MLRPAHPLMPACLTPTEPDVSDEPDAARDGIVGATRELFALRDACADADRRSGIEAALVDLNLPLADGVASRYSGRGVERDDLVQVARLGLLKAVRRFSLDRGVAFSSFAIPTVTGEVKRHFRDHGWAVRPPRRLQELHARVGPAVRDLEQQLHRDPEPAELATRLGVDVGQLGLARAAATGFATISLDHGHGPSGGPTGDGGEAPSLDQTLPSTDSTLDLAEDRIAVQGAVAQLSPRERRVVELRFDLDLTQAQIASELGVSQMQVSRIIARLLGRLRAILADAGMTTTAA